MLFLQKKDSIRDGFSNLDLWSGLRRGKETALERADFTLQLLMFETAEKERVMLIIFFLFMFCLLLFKLGQAECVQTMKDLTKVKGAAPLCNLSV